jgi:hypothetical protein
VTESRSLRGQAYQVTDITEHKNMMKGLVTIKKKTVVKLTEIMF